MRKTLPIMPPLICLAGHLESTLSILWALRAEGAQTLPLDALAREIVQAGGRPRSRMGIEMTLCHFASHIDPDAYRRLAASPLQRRSEPELRRLVRELHEVVRDRFPALAEQAIANGWGDRHAQNIGDRAEPAGPLTIAETLDDLAFLRLAVAREDGPLAGWDLVVVECVQYPGEGVGLVRAPDITVAASPPAALASDPSWLELPERARTSITDTWRKSQVTRIHGAWLARRSEAEATAHAEPIGGAAPC